MLDLREGGGEEEGEEKGTEPGQEHQEPAGPAGAGTQGGKEGRRGQPTKTEKQEREVWHCRKGRGRGAWWGSITARGAIDQIIAAGSDLARKV